MSSKKSKREESAVPNAGSDGTKSAQVPRESIRHLVELGGRTAQSFGLGRVLGEILTLLYFSEGERSLDEMEAELGLSKAAVSVAARDLEKLGFVQRVWRANDRRSYYRTVDNLGMALRYGVLRQIESSMLDVENVLAQVKEDLQEHEKEHGTAPTEFLNARIERAEVLQTRARRFLTSPLLKLLVK